MIKYVIYSVNLLVVAFVVGSMFGVWFGLNPNQQSYTVFLEQQQQLIRTLNVKLPLLGLLGIIFTALSLFLSRGDRNSLILLAIATILLIVSGLVTRFMNQPINAQFMTWVVENPPSDWMQLRDKWWMWHYVRMGSGILSLTLLVFGLLIKQN